MNTLVCKTLFQGLYYDTSNGDKKEIVEMGAKMTNKETSLHSILVLIVKETIQKGMIPKLLHILKEYLFSHLKSYTSCYSWYSL